MYDFRKSVAMSEFDPRKTTDCKDKDLDGIIRPQELGAFTGQREIVSNLHVYIEAAKMRGESLDHTLSTGLRDWARLRLRTSSQMRWGSI